MWKYCDRYIRLCSLQCSSHPSLFLFKMQMKIIYFVELVFVYQCADSFTVGMYSTSSLSVLLIKCHQIKHILVNVKWFRVPFSAHTSHILHHIYIVACGGGFPCSYWKFKMRNHLNFLHVIQNDLSNGSHIWPKTLTTFCGSWIFSIISFPF